MVEYTSTEALLYKFFGTVVKVAEPGQSDLRGPSEPTVPRMSSSHRWVPPNAREAIDPNELVFRRIRGILNKLTPDNFEKLILELTHHAGAGSSETLKGTILLVFDKALDEPNYSRMYAQLCLRLNDFAPNFPEPANQKSQSFRKLLLHKCQEEFENRRQASAAFDRQDGLSPEQQEQKAIAKRKMLGNIKFVGELFKLGMLHEAIIHSCIKELLEKKRNQSVEETSKSIECLCHFMTTVGKKLDTEKAKGWMGKYFERMKSLSTNKELPSRIRFMLMDIIDLRKNKWLPRRSTMGDAPRPIHEIRQEAYQEMKPPRGHSGPPAPLNIHPFHTQPPFRGPGGPNYFPPPPGGDEGFLSSPPGAKDSLLSPQDTEAMATFPPPPQVEVQQPKSQSEKPAEKKQPRKLPSGKTNETVSLRPAMASLKLGSARPSNKPSTPPVAPGGGQGLAGEREERQSPVPRTRDDSSDEEAPPRRSGNKGTKPPLLLGPHVPPRGPYPPHMPPPPHQHPYMMPIPAPRPMPMYMPHPGHMVPPPGPHMPPRQFPPQPHPPRGYIGPPPPGVPALPYLGPMYGPPRPPAPYGPPQWVPGPMAPMDGPRPPPNGMGLTPDRMPHPLPPGLERNEPVVVKYVSKSGKKGGASGGGKKGGGASSESERMEPIISQFLQTRDMATAATAIERLKGVSKEMVCTLLMTKTLERSEDDRTHVSELLCELQRQQLITGANFLQAFNRIMVSIVDYESNLAQCKMYIAGFVARAVAKDLVTLSDILPTFNQGSHHPTILVVLQALVALIGEEAVLKEFQTSSVKLTALLPVSLRSHDAIAELMESKNLAFLYPLKRVQTELAGRLKQEPSAVAVYKWIKNNVNSSFYTAPEFVMILTRCILDHVTRGSSLASGVNRSEGAGREVVAKEKELMLKFKILVQKFVNENMSLQISTLYATQVFCHDNQFPKGLLLRLFSYWYDMDVVDEEAFFQWKEDITQEYPGKGQALFQVNQWLILLAEAEDEGTSSEDDS